MPGTVSVYWKLFLNVVNTRFLVLLFKNSYRCDVALKEEKAKKLCSELLLSTKISISGRLLKCF